MCHIIFKKSLNSEHSHLFSILYYSWKTICLDISTFSRHIFHGQEPKRTPQCLTFIRYIINQEKIHEKRLTFPMCVCVCTCIFHLMTMGKTKKNCVFFFSFHVFRPLSVPSKASPALTKSYTHNTEMKPDRLAPAALQSENPIRV